MANYEEEFPGFGDMPLNWQDRGLIDISWHKDSCPCFAKFIDGIQDNEYLQFSVWIDWEDRELREFPESHRYMIVTGNGDDEEYDVAIETDDITEIEAWLDEHDAKIQEK